ncbi:hypothetical protein BDR22DRAFT_818366 [Usnea florida]
MPLLGCFKVSRHHSARKIRTTTPRIPENGRVDHGNVDRITSQSSVRTQDQTRRHECYGPVPTPQLVDEVHRTILELTRSEGNVYSISGLPIWADWRRITYPTATQADGSEVLASTSTQNGNARILERPSNVPCRRWRINKLTERTRKGCI